MTIRLIGIILSVCALFLSIEFVIGLVGRTQSAGVKGKLICRGSPAKGVKVKLYDDDRGVDLDDLMDEGYTDANGDFTLSGYVDEITTIDPKLNIYHDCNDYLVIVDDKTIGDLKLQPCQRKFSIMIPDQYVSLGKFVHNYYNAGKIELSGELSGETRDCIN